ncbi:amino acid ABC transporter permease [Allokutzneria albata]|uniref:Amino acid ABC transporter membrane protein 2, PAAT family n=1 Tax=Allokutzneria albata TaxID=211114 RepID=A0A1H0CTK9_ALLAB|nr:amino acid ABC transporter permease [Allokutzneria albata]SDN61209.1 amino acid ABC transporter membrane protein 2, PAAT family [Allokutzneria albata]
MSAPSVLYDAPGPKARARNIGYTVVFGLAVVAVAWWVLATLSEKGQLAPELWAPFVTDGRVWTQFLLPGLGNTLFAALLSVVIAMPIGFVFGIARLSDHKWIRVPAGAVVEFFRAIPVLILMVFASELFSLYTDLDRDTRPLFAVVTGLVLYNGSVMAEIVRAGILSLPKGQSEAAAALGLRKGQTMRIVLLPQAVTAMLPAIVSQLVVILKDTALGGAILTFPELLRTIRPIAANYHNNVIATLVVVGLIYVVINTLLTTFATWLEKRMSRRGRPTIGGEMVEEQAPGMQVVGTTGGDRTL